MKRFSDSRLRDSNPQTTPTRVPSELFEEITGEPIGQQGPDRPGRKLHLRLRATKGLAALAALSVVGVGVAWSATGNNPVAIVVDKVGKRLVPPKAGTNLFSDDQAPLPQGLSILERADESSIEALPAFTKRMLQMQQMGFRQDDLDRARIENDFDLENVPWVIHPKFIRGTGEAVLPSGQEVSVVALEDQICGYWLQLEEAMCGSDKAFTRKGIYTMRIEHFRKGPWEIFGLVDDRVASVTAESSSVIQSATVENNVFQLPPLPPFDVSLTAYADDGSVLYSTFFR